MDGADGVEHGGKIGRNKQRRNTTDNLLDEDGPLRLKVRWAVCFRARSQAVAILILKACKVCSTAGIRLDDQQSAGNGDRISSVQYNPLIQKVCSSFCEFRASEVFEILDSARAC